MTFDLFGHAEAAKQFKDIGNQRPSTAEQKAVLLMQLGAELKVVPPHVRNGSIQDVRAWTAKRDVCVKAANKRNASVKEIENALHTMRLINAPKASA